MTIRGVGFALLLSFILLVEPSCVLDTANAREKTGKVLSNPKASPEPDTELELNTVGTDTRHIHYYVDAADNWVGVGRMVKILIDGKKEHHVVAWPEGYRPKDDFIHPPYSEPNILSFTFMLGDKDRNSKPPFSSLCRGCLPPVVPPDDGAEVVLDTWAVIIGISKYQDSRIPQLRFADADAQALYDWATTKGGEKYRADHIKLLLNENATTVNIRDALTSWAERPLKENRLIIYFACHGTPDSPGSTNLYLVSYDAKFDKIAATAYPMYEVKESIQRFVHAKEVVVIADACHAGGVSESFKDVLTRDPFFENPLAEGLRGLFPATEAAPAEQPHDVCVISATDKGQLSREDKKWGGGHGVFTYYLVDGLGGNADKDHNGKILISELTDYVSLKVREDTESKQTPMNAGMWSPNMIMATCRRAAP